MRCYSVVYTMAILKGKLKKLRTHFCFAKCAKKTTVTGHVNFKM